MKIILFTMAAFMALNQAETPVGQQFPDLKCETLTDKTLNIPQDTKGKSTIICMAYSKDAELELKTWYEPTYNKFIAKTELMSDAYDINLYFVPMFTGVVEGTAGNAKKQMKEGVQADIQPHILVYKGALDAYKEKLNMDDKKNPYIFVLDETGKIIYATSGAYTEEKMDEIEDQIG